jgi:hypothetical protein
VRLALTFALDIGNVTTRITELCMGGNAMGRFLYRTLIGGAGLLAASTFAFAGEQILEFKFVIKLLDPKVLEAANIDGQTMIASKGFGVAYFKDGRVAINDFIITYDLAQVPVEGMARTRSRTAPQLLRASPESARRVGCSAFIRSYRAPAHMPTPPGRAASRVSRRSSKTPAGDRIPRVRLSVVDE